jgi:hypothetical protein
MVPFPRASRKRALSLRQSALVTCGDTGEEIMGKEGSIWAAE